MSIIGKLCGQFFIFKQNTAKWIRHTKSINLFVCNFDKCSPILIFLDKNWTLKPIEVIAE